MRLRLWSAAMAALALAGCDFAPRYVLPSPQLPATFRDAAEAGRTLPSDREWWRVFREASLDGLEAKVDAANPTLAAAVAANDVAQARALEALAGLAPRVDAVGQITANRQSNNRPLRSKGQPDYYGNNSLGGQVSWEIDLWGRVRDIASSANASSEASADALDQARLELHAELARDYVDLRGLDDEARVVAAAIGVYRSALDLTKSRLAAQIASPVDVDRAQTQLSGAEAQASDLALRRSSLVDAIATLTGEAAPSFSLPRSTRPIPLPARPRAAPADLLRWRPDVAEAERLTAAANYGVGAARANFFPRFSLIALGGTEDTGYRLFNIGNAFGTIGPSVDLPLFDAGLRQAELEVAKAAFTEQVERYRATVLQAVREVQDEVSALRWLAAEQRQTATAAASARRAADQSMTLYRDGATSYLDVVTAQSAALDAERLTIALHARELEANIGLMLALGGGWTKSAPPPPPAIDATPTPVQIARELTKGRP